MGVTDNISLNRILTNAAGWHASDVHFVVGSQPTVRVDGKLVTLTDEQIVTADFLQTVVKNFLNEAQRNQLVAQKEIVAAYSVNSQLRFKIMVVYQRGSLSVAIHFIPTVIRSLAELGLPAAVNRFVNLSKGLVFVTGPYGSGRTTTMNALVNEINSQRAANVVTIESPIEYLFVNNKSTIEQREVGRDALSCEQAIVAACREDVDVIVVAEVSDASVIAAMLEAAEAGRLVISTMSTDSILSTIEKVINSFPTGDVLKIRTQLASVLAGIISQRLLPRIGGGQVAVSEVMIPTPPVRAVIRDGALAQMTNVLQTNREPGLMSFDRALTQLVQQGVISFEDALLHAQDPSAMKARSH